MKRIRSFFPVIILIFFALGIRILYAWYHPAITVTADSYEYYTLANNMAKKPSVKLIINPYRPPLYSSVILLSMVATGSVNAPIGGGQFTKSMEFLMLLQGTVAIFSILLFYTTLITLNITKRFAFIATLLVSGNMLLIPWERTLLTESFAISWLIIFASVFAHTFALPTRSAIVKLWILSVIGLYLRPAFLFLPFVAFLLIALYHWKKNILISCLLATILYAFVPIVHSSFNRHHWQYDGFFVIGQFNLLGRILQFHLPIEHARQAKYFYDTVTQYRAGGGVPNPYRFLDSYDPDIYVKADRLNELSRFNALVIRASLPAFIVKSLLDTPKAFTEISPYIRVDDTHIFGVLQKIFQLLQLVSFVSVLAIPIATLQLRNTKKRPGEAILGALGILAWFQVFISVFLGYEDFGRLAAPAMPLILVFSFYWITTVLDK